jgi:apolipoprotein N-acyltransferase
MVSAAERLCGSSGWRARLAAFVAGVLSVLAMAPFFLWPVLWITLPVLVWLIDGAVRRNADKGPWRRLAAAGETGWWWGFGYLLAGLHWIGEAFLVEAEIFAVFMPFAVVLLPAAMAVYYGAATAAAAMLWKSGPWRVLALALSLSATEWLRGHMLTGFPWNVLGYALTYPVELMQSAALLGIYGLTMAAVLIFGLPAVLWSEAAAGQWGRKWAALAVALLPLVIAGALGHARLAIADSVAGWQSATVPGVKIRIVQPSVPQREKWHPENWARFFQDHLDLSGRNPAGVADRLAGVTHVIWPEAAMPFPPLDTPEALAAIGDLLPEGTVLIAGANRIEWTPGPPRRPRRFFNSLLVFGKGGLLLSLYDKVHLVPFGEYLPYVLRPLLGLIGMQQLAGRVGFETGISPRPLLTIPRLPAVVPLICYEAIFPAAVVQGPDPSQQRPGLIINLTNDGWFGNTTGPRQHLQQARVRAVEEGLPLVRAANNGVSAAFDAYGRSLGQLDLNVRGVIDVPLPVALPAPAYARLGDALFLAMWLSGIVLLSCVMWRR